MSGLIIMRNPGESEEDFNNRAKEVKPPKMELVSKSNTTH